MGLVRRARPAASQARFTDLPRAVLAILRRLRVEPRLALLFVVVVGAVGVLSGIPRYLDHVSEEGLRRAMTDAPVQVSGLGVAIDGRIDPNVSEDAFADLRSRGQRYHAGLPEAVGNILADGHYLADTPKFELVDAAGNPLYGSLLQYPTLRLRYQDDVWNHVRLVDGRLPQAHAQASIAEMFGNKVTASQEVVHLWRPVYEIAVTQATADALRVRLGDRFLALPTPGNIASSGLDSRSRDTTVIIQVVGIIDVPAPADSYWFGDTAVSQPSITSFHESYYIDAVALPAPDQQVYADLYRATVISAANALSWSYRWQYPVLPSQVESGGLSDLRNGLRNLEVTKGPVGQVFDSPGEVTIHTGLPGIVDQFEAERDAVVGVLEIAVVGLFALAATVFALVVILIDERRKGMTLLLRSRGASWQQLLAAQASEAVLVCGPAALAGYVVARALLGSGGNQAAIVVALVAAIVFIVVDILVALGPMLRSLGSMQRHVGRANRLSLPMVAVEGTMVLLAIIGVVLIRRRGLLTSETGGFAVDPFLAATPVLLSLAAGLLARRFVMLLALIIERLAARWRGLVPLLGVRRISSWSRAAGLPLAVMIVATGLGVFTFVIDDSLDRAISATTWQTVGAQYRVDMPRGVPTGFDPTKVDGVVAAARSLVVDGVQIGEAGAESKFTTAIGIEPAAYDAVTSGTPISSAFPATFVDDDGSDVLPGIASAALLSENNLKLGSTLTLSLGPQQARVRIVAVRDSFPGVDGKNSFLLLPYDRLQSLAQANGARASSNSVFLRGASGRESSLRAALRDTLPGATLFSQHELERQMRDAPFSRGLLNGFRLASSVALLCAIGAAISGLILISWQRNRDVAYLRVLGLSQRQSFALLMLEQLPSVVIAGGIGAVLGIATIRLVAPGIDLDPFVSNHSVPIVIDGLSILALVSVLVGIVACCLVVSGILLRRVRIGQTLRVGD